MLTSQTDIEIKCCFLTFDKMSMSVMLCIDISFIRSNVLSIGFRILIKTYLGNFESM